MPRGHFRDGFSVPHQSNHKANKKRDLLSIRASFGSEVSAGRAGIYNLPRKPVLTHNTINPGVDKGAQNRLREVIDKYLSVVTSKLGNRTLFEYEIELLGDRPVRSRPYHLSPLNLRP